MAKARVAVVLAGGSGERFWPLSRAARPKQLLSLPGDTRTMLDATLQRLGPIADRVSLAASTPVMEALASHWSGFGEIGVTVEPDRRNTAGAIVWATAAALWSDPELADGVMVFAPADHYVATEDDYRRTLGAAIHAAQTEGGLITIGVRPTRSETGYGYIQIDSETAHAVESHTAYRVKRFHEKPSPDLAVTYLTQGGYFWNSGIFAWRVDEFRRELRETSPAHDEAIDRILAAYAANDMEAAFEAFRALPDISIDYALLERASNTRMVEAAFEWDDLGSWDAMARFLPTDLRGNAVRGDAELVQSADCMVYNESEGITVGLLGVYGLLVVATDDAILICDKDKAQDVRALVQALRNRQSPKV